MRLAVYLLLPVATVIVLAESLLICASASAQTLDEALVAAYRNNPALEIQRASVRAVDEQVSQAFAGWRPSVTLSGSIGHTDTPLL